MEIVGNEVYEAENPKAMMEARDFSHGEVHKIENMRKEALNDKSGTANLLAGEKG